jgi:hypothetical protein
MRSATFGLSAPRVDHETAVSSVVRIVASIFLARGVGIE